MKKYYFFILMLLLTINCYANDQILENLIRNFEGNSQYINASTTFQHIENVYGDRILKATDTSYLSLAMDTKNSWCINKDKNKVTSGSYRLARFTGNEIYTIAQCKDIAMAFAQSKYSNFNNINWTCSLDYSHYRPETGKYSFVLEEYINNVLTSNRIYIEVRFDIGEVNRFWFDYGSNTNIPTPVIDYNTAINTVLNQVGDNVVLDTCYIPYLKYSRNNELVWIISLDCYKDKRYIGANYAINALNGNIVEGDYGEYKIMKSEIKEKESKPLEEIKKIINDIQIKEKDDKIIIKNQSKEYILQIDSEYIEYKGYKGKFNQKVKKINNKIMVPSNILDYIK